MTFRRVLSDKRPCRQGYMRKPDLVNRLLRERLEAGLHGDLRRNFQAAVLRPLPM